MVWMLCISSCLHRLAHLMDVNSVPRFDVKTCHPSRHPIICTGTRLHILERNGLHPPCCPADDGQQVHMPFLRGREEPKQVYMHIRETSGEYTQPAFAAKSSMLSSGYASGSVTMLSWRKSSRCRQLPLFSCTMYKVLAPGEVDL